MGANQDETEQAEAPLDPKRVELLRGVGVIVTHDEKWVGEVGKGRHPEPLLGTILATYLPLSPAEWCSLAMREGENYVGGCCGNMSALQDVINGVFRDSGTVNSATLLSIAELALDHDVFEEFSPLSDEEFSTLIV